VLDCLSADLRAQGPDHIAVTGDLTHIALPSEFRAGKRWLASLGRPDQVTVIPGNHETYVPFAWSRGLGLWQDFMTGAAEPGAAETPARGPADFPLIRRRGPAAFISLTSAEPMPLSTPAAGRLGPAQLRRLEDCLTRLGREGLFRIVLIHHAPDPSISIRKALLDAEDFLAVLRRAGAEIVLHGHLHEATRWQLATGPTAIPVIGLPSASARAHRGRPEAHYLLCTLAGMHGNWQLSAAVRAYDPAAGTIQPLARQHWHWQDHVLTQS
jgi:3',5'-cyclic AMP phosphodiesterase CpdA